MNAVCERERGTVRRVESPGGPWSARQWCDYYEENKTRLLSLPWERGAELTAREQTAVIASLQDFQIGEQSEGHNLHRRAALCRRHRSVHRRGTAARSRAGTLPDLYRLSAAGEVTAGRRVPLPAEAGGAGADADGAADRGGDRQGVLPGHPAGD